MTRPAPRNPKSRRSTRRPANTAVATIGLGIDLVNIPRMRDVIARWDDRFLKRVFTEAEIAYCRARRDPVPHFAARFAAKEAAMKALGTGLSLGVRWRDLEVRRDRGQAPRLLMHGRSRELGLARGGRAMLVALTHDGDYALAQTMLVNDEPHVDPTPR
jgi:holo-[acyl-carrier protein] synthase